MDYKLIISTLKANREAQKISGRPLSEKIGRSATYITEIERGKYKLNIESYVEICKILKIDPVELLSQSLNKGGE